MVELPAEIYNSVSSAADTQGITLGQVLLDTLTAIHTIPTSQSYVTTSTSGLNSTFNNDLLRVSYATNIIGSVSSSSPEYMGTYNTLVSNITPVIEDLTAKAIAKLSGKEETDV